MRAKTRIGSRGSSFGRGPYRAAGACFKARPGLRRATLMAFSHGGSCMANRNRDFRDDRGSAGSGGSESSMAGVIRVATLIGVGLLVAMNAKMITDTGSFKESVSQLNERIDSVNNRIV